MEEIYIRKIGIDLGTTNSLIAYWSDNGPIIIPNSLGNNLTPSIVSLNNSGEVSVGEVAKEISIISPELSASVFKRNMGTKQIYKIGKREFLPEELSALILKSLKRDAEVFLNEEVTEVVISVPAYFNDAQRKATKRAGELAGLKVERLITEPTAAALSYGLQNEKPETKFLVFDLGGGTFDVSILELFDGIMEVRSVAGDNYLGGEDFTEILIDIFLMENKLIKIELEEKVYSTIKKSAEASKREFEEKDSVEMTCIIEGQAIKTTIYKETYEKRCRELLIRLRTPLERALSDAKLSLSDIDSVLLVGGATKLSFIRNFVGRLFGKLPFVNINPDEVVALGAAIQAALIGKNAEFDEIILTDVCPYTLGTEVSKEIDGVYEPGYYFPIIERNTIIPVSRVKPLVTIYDNQTEIELSILQGESRLVKNNIPLGKLLVTLPPNKAGEEIVDVRYTYDINGLLEVCATVKSTGVKRNIIIDNNSGSMTEEEIKKRMKELEFLKVHPREDEKNKLLIARGERLYEEVLGEKRKYIEEILLTFEKTLERQDKREIDDLRKMINSIFDAIDIKGDF